MSESDLIMLNACPVSSQSSYLTQDQNIASNQDITLQSEILNNYGMRSSRIWGIIKAEVCVICLSLRLRLRKKYNARTNLSLRARQITQTEALIIPHILREPNSIIVLLFIFIWKPFSRRNRPFVFFAFGISSIN